MTTANVSHIPLTGAPIASEPAPAAPGSSATFRLPGFLRRIPWRGLLLPAILLGLWEGFSHSGLINTAILPSLETIARTLGGLVISGDLWIHLGASILRLLGGFIIAAILGLAVGTVCALSRGADLVLGTPIAAIRQVPLFGWIPLIAVIAGIGEASKVVFVVLAAFYPIVLNTTQGLRNAPAELVEVGRVFGFGRWLLLRRVLLPQAVPAVLTGLKHGLTFAGLATVSAEVFMTAGPGLGNLLDYGQANMRVDLVLIGVAFIGLLGVSLTSLITLLERRLLRWRTPNRQDQP